MKLWKRDETIWCLKNSMIQKNIKFKVESKAYRRNLHKKSFATNLMLHCKNDAILYFETRLDPTSFKILATLLFASFVMTKFI